MSPLDLQKSKVLFIFLSGWTVGALVNIEKKKTNPTQNYVCSTIKSGKWRMQFKKWNITVKDTYVAYQAFLGLDKKPNPQFQSQKPETLSTPCTH